MMVKTRHEEEDFDEVLLRLLYNHLPLSSECRLLVDRRFTHERPHAVCLFWNRF